MKATAYIRVSSKGQNFDLQRDAVAKAAAARGDEVDVWKAEKKSAKTMDRPELQQLLADVRAGTVKRIYVFKLDRLTRSGVSDTFETVSTLRKNGCELIAVADNIHVKVGADDIVTDVLLFAFGLAAKLERTARNERIAAKREAVEAAGGRWGRPRRLDDEQVERIIAMRVEGRTLRECAVAMKVPRSTIQLALARNADAKTVVPTPAKTTSAARPATRAR